MTETLTISDAAQLLQISRSRISAAEAAGKIRRVDNSYPVRIRKDDLLAWHENGSNPHGYGVSKPDPKRRFSELSVRVNNCLRYEGLTDIDAICAKSENDFKGIENFGEGSLNELKAWLASQGRQLRPPAEKLEWLEDIKNDPIKRAEVIKWLTTSD